MTQFRIMQWLAAATLVAVVGCGDAGSAVTTKIDGVVSLDGAPVPNARVQFLPAPGSKGGGRPAQGTSDASGKFKLTSYKPDDGAQPGSYSVVVTGEGVPKKYTDAGTTDLKVTVEQGKKDLKIDLKKE